MALVSLQVIDGASCAACGRVALVALQVVESSGAIVAEGSRVALVFQADGVAVR